MFGFLTKKKFFPISCFREFANKGNVISSTTESEEFLHAKPYKDIPKVPSFPIVNSYWGFLPLIGKYDINRRHVADMKDYEKYGKIFRCDIGEDAECVVIYDPEDIGKMFRNEGQYPERKLALLFEVYKHYHKLTQSLGVTSSHGAEWKRIRGKVQKYLMKPDAMDKYLPAMNQAADEAIKWIGKMKDVNGEVNDLCPNLFNYAMESVSLTLMDSSIGAFAENQTESSESRILAKVLQDGFIALGDVQFGNNLWKYFPSKPWRVISDCFDVLNRMAENYVQKIRKNIDPKKEKRNLIEELLISENLSEIDVTGVISDLLLTGINTTANYLAFSVYLLATNQDAQEKAYKEVITASSNTKDKITAEILDKIPYLKACAKESLRVLPILTFNRRTIAKDCVMSGYKIPAGVIVMAKTLATGWLEEHFPNPKSFQPERWLKERKDEVKPYSYVPFGFGPRICLGKRLAEHETWIFLAKILQKYKLEYHHDAIDMITYFIHNPDKPLKIKFIERS